MSERLFIIIILLIVVFMFFIPVSDILKVKSFVLGYNKSEFAGKSNLIAQNAALKAHIAELSAMQKTAKPNYENGAVKAFAYFNYPFNLKNELIISAGSNDGIKVGQAAVIPLKDFYETGKKYKYNFLMFGIVNKVFDDTSVVRTVFDSKFKIAARIGDNGYEALLVGGTNPKLSFIQKDADVEDGDVVYSADISTNQNIGLGFAENVRLSRNGVFKEAELTVPYDLNEYNLVFVLKNGK